MSMFNSDQNDYMAYLARRPPESKCYCGWHDAGECPNCPKHLTAADKMAVWCPECHSSPWPTDPSRPVIHAYGCSIGKANKEGATP